MQSLFVLHANGVRDVVRNPQEQYAVHLAAAVGFRDGLLYMLKNMGADIDARNGQGATPLTLAIENDRLDVASALLARGAMVAKPPSRGSFSQGVALPPHEATGLTSRSRKPREITHMCLAGPCTSYIR